MSSAAPRRGWCTRWVDVALALGYAPSLLLLPAVLPELGRRVSEPREFHGLAIYSVASYAAAPLALALVLAARVHPAARLSDRLRGVLLGLLVCNLPPHYLALGLWASFTSIGQSGFID